MVSVVMRAVMRLTALIALSLAASLAHAYPASQTCAVTWANTGIAYADAAASAAAQDAYATSNGFTNTGEWCSGALGGAGTCNVVAAPSCGSPAVFRKVLINGNPYTLGTHTPGAASSSCPSGGTLSGSTCTCAQGETDTGSSCVAASCPAVGTSIGTHNLTVGWSLSPTPDANDAVVAPNFGSLYSSEHCIQSGGSMCPTAVDTAAADFVPSCWRSQAPNASGLYRNSCDFVMKSAGTSTCTPSASSPSDNTNAGPACPTGNVGTVNGVAVCLGAMPTTGINFGKQPAAGNPRAGTSPISDSNAAREPSAGSGGGPDARGGPGVTVGAGNSIGTGSNRSAGSGAGSGSIPIEVEVITCGLPDTPKCKIDETGTPTGLGAYDASKTALTDATKALTDGVGAAAGATSGRDTAWKITFSPPTGCTNPPAFVLARAGINWTPDLCQFSTEIGAVASFLWLLLTLGSCLAMIRGTAVGGA